MSVRLFLSITLTATLGFSNTAFAQSKREVLAMCAEAITVGDEQKLAVLAEDIKSWTTIFNYEIETKGAACISAATGDEWIYSKGLLRFVSQSELQSEREARNAEVDAREALLQSARCELLEDLQPLIVKQNELKAQIEANERELASARLSVQLETVEACQDWYTHDRAGALTNPVCNSLFLQIGVQPLTVGLSGNYESEIEFLEKEIQSIRSDVSIIDEQKKLPEEVAEENYQGLRNIMIERLPVELRERAEGMSVEEISLMGADYELSKCN